MMPTTGHKACGRIHLGRETPASRLQWIRRKPSGAAR